MTVEDSEKIDIISIDPKSDEVVLTIADHLDWSDEYEHLLTLQTKLNAYLSFIHSGEILHSYPKARNRRAVIDIAFKHEPPPIATEFVMRAAESAAEIGVGVRARVNA